MKAGTRILNRSCHTLAPRWDSAMQLPGTPEARGGGLEQAATVCWLHMPTPHGLGHSCVPGVGRVWPALSAKPGAIADARLTGSSREAMASQGPWAAAAEGSTARPATRKRRTEASQASALRAGAASYRCFERREPVARRRLPRCMPGDGPQHCSHSHVRRPSGA